MSIFNGSIFSAHIFNASGTTLTGTIPRDSRAALAVTGRLSATVTVPARRSTITAPARPRATVED